MTHAPDRCYFKELRLQQYRALVHLARSDGFAGASATLGISRSSIWRQVRALERELACELVALTRRKVTLTPAGRLLLELVVPMLAEFEHIVPEFQRRLQQGHRSLVIAAPQQLLIYEFPPAIEQLREQHPWLNLRLVSEPSTVSLEMLQRHEADVAVVGHMEQLHQDPSLSCVPITTYDTVVLCPPDHRLTRKKKWAIEDIAACPLIMPTQRTSSRVRFDAAFARQGLLDQMQVVLESNNLTSVMPYVRRGFAVGFYTISHHHLAELNVMQERGEIAYRSVNDLFGDETVYFVTTKSRAGLPHVEDFRRILSTRMAAKPPPRSVASAQRPLRK